VEITVSFYPKPRKPPLSQTSDVVAVLTPPKFAPFATWMVGWSNYIGLVLGCPSVNYGNASMISALALYRNPLYEDTLAKRFGISV
jgi:hypothetical protein